MTARGKIGRWYRAFMFLLGAFFTLGLPQTGEAAIIALLEGPDEGQQLAGIGLIRGWAFSDTTGVRITKVTALIDNTLAIPIPCCAARGDVAAAYPQNPNAVESGWGIAVNYGNLSPGAHAITVRIDEAGGTSRTLSRNVTVVKMGGFNYLDQFDISSSTARIEGKDILVAGGLVRDKLTQRVVQTTSRLRWFSYLQGLGMVETVTTGAASALTIPHLQSSPTRVTAAQTAAVAALHAALESPANNQIVAGLAVLQGWAFATAGRTIRRVQLLIDGQSVFAIPWGSPREDVAQAFPNEPNARDSGFGIAINYGNLSSGVHTVEIELEDSGGTVRRLLAGVVVERPGDFPYLDDLDVSTATTRIAGGMLVVAGVRVRDKATQQTATRILRYRFDVPAQAFLLEDESVDEVPVENLNCTINGDTSNVSALKNNRGGDGISLPEAIQASNNTPNNGSIFIDWEPPGTVQCPTPVALHRNVSVRPQFSDGPLPAITRGNITLSGDVDGNGSPDVTLDGFGFNVLAGQTFIRNFTMNRVPAEAVNIVARPGTSIAHVAILGIDATVLPSSLRGIRACAELQTEQRADLRHLLVGSSQIHGADIGIQIDAQGSSGSSEPTLRDILVTDNTITGGSVGILIEPSATAGTIFTALTVAANRIQNSANAGIRLKGGFSTARNNTVDARVLGNVIANAEGEGVLVSAGVENTQDNIVMAELRGNEVQHSRFYGIRVEGGSFTANANMVEAMVGDNVVTDSGADGIFVESGSVTSLNNVIHSDIQGNELRRNGGKGASLSSGFDNAQNNMILGTVQGNMVQNNAQSGVGLIAGWLASNNTVSALVTDNSVSNSGDNGIVVIGGTAEARESTTGETRNNEITGEIRRNVVQGSGIDGIAVFGGLDNTSGVVAKNRAQQNITNNTADGIRCEAGIAGNTATCTIADNTVTSAVLAAQSKGQDGTQPSGLRPFPASDHALPLSEASSKRLDAKVQLLRERAQHITDARVRARLQGFANRLEAMKGKGE